MEPKASGGPWHVCSLVCCKVSILRCFVTIGYSTVTRGWTCSDVFLLALSLLGGCDSGLIANIFSHPSLRRHGSILPWKSLCICI